MRHFITALMTIMLFFAGLGVAGAIPFEDHYDAKHKDMSAWSVEKWTFDITKDGFDPDSMDVTSASVTLKFEDDGCDWWEAAYLKAGENRFIWEVDTGDISFSIDSLISLSTTGTVACALTIFFGDVFFDGASLFAEAISSDSGSVPTPEPQTALMFLIGFAVLFGFCRKELFKRKS